MDGDCNKNEARNKHYGNSSRQSSNQSNPNPNQSVNPTPPCNHHAVVRGAFARSTDSSLPSYSSLSSDSSSQDSEFSNTGDQVSRSMHVANDHRHSLSGMATANGATSGNSSSHSAVVKASSTGTISTSPSRLLAQAAAASSSRNENSPSSSSTSSSSNPPNPNPNAFQLSFPTLSCSGSSLGNATAAMSMSASANAAKSANANSSSTTLNVEPTPSNSLLNNQYPSLNAPSSSSSPSSTSCAPQPISNSSPPQNYDQAMYNWQDSKTCVKDRLTYLFNTDTMTDIQFQVGKPPSLQMVSAHKFVLSIGSAVFDALFNGRLATSDSIIEIPDVEPAAFSALLRFLYTDEVQIGPETVMTTLYAAKKYAVPALERACVDFLKRNLSSDNAFMLLTQARLFDEPQLAALCLETIDKNTTEALAADGFTDIDLDTLCCVLERDTLGIRECRLFSAVCRWAEAECVRQNLVPPTSENLRKVLFRALRLIRFPLMTVEEFAMGSAQSGILEDREVVELFLYFTVNPKPPISFLDVPRCCLTGKEQVVSRFCQIESRWGYSGTSDRIRFMVNRRIFVVGFGLYGSIHGPTEYAVNIQIIHMDSAKVMGSNEPTFQCDGSTSTFRVMFKEPVEILPNTSYIACATLRGPDSYYGSKGLRKVTHESVSSGKVTFHFTYAAGNNNGTSVEDGQIPEIIFYT